MSFKFLAIYIALGFIIWWLVAGPSVGSGQPLTIEQANDPARFRRAK